ncbi:MAG: hypothetical protein IPN86_07155 [Saprospiraceae bacterium]|nr:hypothetical protein [Saprospiraceae bacterium]
MVEAVLVSNGQVTGSAVTDMDGVYKLEGLENKLTILSLHHQQDIMLQYRERQQTM